MDPIDFPQLAFEFDELINGSFVQQIFSSSSSSKADSLLLEFILENDQKLPKESPDFYDDHLKDNDQSPQQQQKIHQLKTKLILSLQGSSSSLSSTTSSSCEDQRQEENDQCLIKSQGLIEKVFSFKQRLRDFSSDSVSQSLKLKSRHGEENGEKTHDPFNKWSDSDCQLLLEEIGTRRITIQSIQNNLQREGKSLCGSLGSIHRSLEKFLSLLSSSSPSPLTPPSDLISECQEEVPGLTREQMSRLLIGLEMLSLGFGIIQIPQWWIDQEQRKPMEERNLISINNGSEQVAHWMQMNLFPSIEPQLLNKEEKKKLVSSIKSNRAFSGCQTLYFLEDVLPSWQSEKEEKQQLFKEAMMAEKQRLFKDLEKQLVIIGNSDYDPEMEDRNIHFFDPVSRIQRKLSNQVGTWISSPSLSSPSSPPPPPSSPSFGIQVTAEPANDSPPASSAAMSLKIQSIIDEINEIKRQHESKQEDEDDGKSNQKRIQNNLPPKVECAWDIFQSFLREETFEMITIGHLSEEEIERIPEEIKYLSRKDLESIQLKGNQVEWLIDRLCVIFSDDCREIRQIGLEIRGVSTEELPSLFTKMSKRLSLSRTLLISDLGLKSNWLTSVPAEIDQLTNLQILDLSSNWLTSMPPEIGQLTNLQKLWLYHNRFTSLPAEIIQLTNLQTLGFNYNQLRSVPAEIRELTNLQELWLYQNQLTSLPTEIGWLTNLKILNLGSNPLTLLPAEISQLTNLQTLNLGSNQLTSVPPEISQLTNLQTLNLSSNQLTSVPDWIGQLRNLQELWLYENQLASVPAEISQLINLQKLWLNHNQFTLVPAEISQLTNMKKLWLNHNQLLTMPAEISQLTNLQTLNLGSNQLTSVPAWIGQLRNLQELWLYENQLASVPAEISQLMNLQSLDLQNNPDLPAEFRNRSHAIFTNLKTLENFGA